MIPSLMVLIAAGALAVAAGAAAGAAGVTTGSASPVHGPPALPAEPPSRPRVSDREPPPAIFTYTVDGRCRIDDTRKLAGAGPVDWADARHAHELVGEEMVFRFVDGRRTRLRERRIRLLGELIEPGTLVCHLRPSGAVVTAWIERRDTSVARRQAPQRQTVAVRDGRIEDLGTFSLILEGAPARPSPEPPLPGAGPTPERP